LMQFDAAYCRKNKVCAGCRTFGNSTVLNTPIIIEKTAPNSSLLCNSCKLKNLAARKVRLKAPLFIHLDLP
jgi:hypothetical protein